MISIPERAEDFPGQERVTWRREPHWRVLAAIAGTGLALALPEEDLSLIPRLAVLFGVGRIAFWIGYLIAPWARGFGMGLTVYPTFGAFAWLVWTALT